MDPEALPAETAFHKKSPYTVVVKNNDGFILFNTLRRSILNLSADFAASYDQLPEGPFILAGAALDPEFARALVDQGCLIPGDLDDRAFARHRFNRKRYQGATLAVTVAPTLDCDLACAYCFERHAVPSRAVRTMSRADQDAFLQFLCVLLAGKRALAVRWFGGEPLLALPAIEHIMGSLRTACGQAGIRLSSTVITNGTRLTGATAAQLAAAGVTGAQVTLDGPRESHDRVRVTHQGGPSFDRILANLAECAGSMAINLRIQVSRANAGGIPALLGDLAALGLQRTLERLYFFPLFDPADGTAQGPPEPGPAYFTMPRFAEVETRLLLEATRLGFRTELLPEPQFPCSSLNPESFVFGPGGAFMECDHFLGRPGLAVGDYRSRSGLDTLASGNYRKWSEYDPYESEPCRSCAMLPLCNGHCPLSKLGDHGAACGKPPACPSWRFNLGDRLKMHLDVPVPSTPAKP